MNHRPKRYFRSHFVRTQGADILFFVTAVLLILVFGSLLTAFAAVTWGWLGITQYIPVNLVEEIYAMHLYAKLAYMAVSVMGITVGGTIIRGLFRRF